jgi:hypothetical protein
MPELAGDPTRRLAELEPERRERVSRLVEGAAPQSRALESRSPHALAEVRDIERSAVPVAEYPRALSITGGAVGAERLLHDR